MQGYLQDLDLCGTRVDTGMGTCAESGHVSVPKLLCFFPCKRHDFAYTVGKQSHKG